MKTKIKYIAPTIELVKLDNEISLALESIPPYGPEEGKLQVPENQNWNVFKA
jgi:hypothetical protein